MMSVMLAGCSRSFSEYMGKVKECGVVVLGFCPRAGFKNRARGAGRGYTSR